MKANKKILLHSTTLVLMLAGITACSSGDSETDKAETDKALRQQIIDNHLDAPFVGDLKVLPENEPIANLGGDLFFSPDLSIDGAVSCASCHHPKKGGGDGIALPIGIGGENSKHVGQERIEAAKKLNKGNIMEGLIPRNSPSVFNSVLYRKNLFWDGRAQYVSKDVQPQGMPGEADDKVIKTGFGISPLIPTPYEQKSLLQTQARMPMSSLFEMKGWLEPNKNNHEIEQSVIAFLRSQPLWCEKFSKVFRKESCEEAITLSTLTQALAEFQATLTFTDSPFEKYIRGDQTALTEKQKQGALLFMTSLEKGGLGCSQCHSGKIFSDENFYNLNLPASGRGANEYGWDLGRHNVDPLAPKFSFRTPNLLNIATTGPHFHNGIAPNLREAVKFHVQDPALKRKATIIELGNNDYDGINMAIHSAFQMEKETVSRLPKKITDEQLDQVVAFLESLTDPCVTDEKCQARFTRDIIESKRPAYKPVAYDVPENPVRKLEKDKIAAPRLACNLKPAKGGTGKFGFVSKDKDVGISHQREVGLVHMGWLQDVVNYGGVSVSDVDFDCLDDVVFDAGAKGLVYYRQNARGGFSQQPLSVSYKEGNLTPLMMDVDGDYHVDLFVGTSGQNPAYVAFDFVNTPALMYFNTLRGPVINASAGDIDNDGDMDIALAFWRTYKSLLQEHLWVGDGHGNLQAYGKQLDLRTSKYNITEGTDDLIRRPHESPFSESDLTFTPNFADIDGDGDEDLLLASDFSRSQVMRNDGGHFTDITDKAVIDDNNGMGAAIGDFFNKGSVDWYVTSIYRGGSTDRTGNHLYRNDGTGKFAKALDAVPKQPKEEWSWGSCTADFNNDGYLDIFYVSGYGEPLLTATYEKDPQKKASQEFLASYSYFAQSTPRMLVNDQKGGFAEVSSTIGFDQPFDGRGIACFDYQQDGDVDIIINPVEGMPRLYVNQLDGSENWLAIRVVGLPGNTEALGTRLVLHTAKGKQYRQVRFENNYMSRNPAQVHFGLGDVDKVEKLEIIYPAPDARTVVIDQPAINKLHIIRQAM